MVICFPVPREARYGDGAAATWEGFKEAAWAVMRHKSDWGLWKGWKVPNTYYLLGTVLGFISTAIMFKFMSFPGGPRILLPMQKKQEI